MQEALLRTGSANKHVFTATIALQQKNGDSFAVRAEMLQAG
jgi:hypothetical protein